MKTEHITYLGNSEIRDTNDITNLTIQHFKKFQVIDKAMHDIEYSNLKCLINKEDGVAFFAIFNKKNTPVTLTFCCFNTSNKEKVIQFAKNYIFQLRSELSKNSKKAIIVDIEDPTEDMFFITLPYGLNCSFDDIITAGEIELYIYDAIRRGLESKKIKLI